jgi:hypothetical protein
MNDRITLDQVDRVFSGIGLPPVDQRSTSPISLHEFLAAETSHVSDELDGSEALQTAFREVLEIARALRRGEEPRSPLYALFFEDSVTLGDIAGRLHTDPRDLEVSLQALVQIGWVSKDDSRPRVRYSLIGLAGY